MEPGPEEQHLGQDDQRRNGWIDDVEKPRCARDDLVQIRRRRGEPKPAMQEGVGKGDEVVEPGGSVVVQPRIHEQRDSEQEDRNPAVQCGAVHGELVGHVAGDRALGHEASPAARREIPGLRAGPGCRLDLDAFGHWPPCCRPFAAAGLAALIASGLTANTW